MVNTYLLRNIGLLSGVGIVLLLTFGIPSDVLAVPSAGPVGGIISDLTTKMVGILNVIIIAIMAWSGFLLARGDSSAVQRIIYGIIGLVVVNSAETILRFFV